MQRLSGTLARRAGLTLALVLGAGILQEGIQLLSRQSALHSDNFSDIGVNMLGGLLGVLVTAVAFKTKAAERACRPLIPKDDRCKLYRNCRFTSLIDRQSTPTNYRVDRSRQEYSWRWTAL